MNYELKLFIIAKIFDTRSVLDEIRQQQSIVFVNFGMKHDLKDFEQKKSFMQDTIGIQKSQKKHWKNDILFDSQWRWTLEKIKSNDLYDVIHTHELDDTDWIDKAQKRQSRLDEQVSQQQIVEYMTTMIDIRINI